MAKKKNSNGKAGAGAAKKSNGTNPSNGTPTVEVAGTPTVDNLNGGNVKSTVTKVITKTTIVNDDGAIHISDIAFYSFVAILLLYFLTTAYVIRLQSIQEYGPVIHEFDPYFNYRATEVSFLNSFSMLLMIISAK